MGQPHFEALLGKIDGSNRIFRTSVPYTVGTVAVYLNGQLQSGEGDEGWTETTPDTGELELSAAPLTGDFVQAFYLDTSVTPKTVVEVTPLKGYVKSVTFGTGSLKEIDRIVSVISTGGGTVSLTMPENSLSVVQGSSKTFELTVRDTSNNPVDLTGGRVVFTVKSDPADKMPLIQKDSLAGVTQVEITSPREGVVRIYLDPSDTKSLKPDFYTFDVWLVQASGKRYPIIAPSVFEVVAGVTLLP